MNVGPAVFGGLLMVGFAGMELFLRRGAVAKSVTPGATDRGTSALIVAAYALAVVAITSKLLPTIALPVVVGWTGIGVGAAGFAIRVWAMRVLGRFYTRTLVTVEGQRVVQEGPYARVRHPGYLGSILTWIGAAASSCNLVSVAAVSVLLTVAYAHRIRSEERMLVQALGEPYVEYQRRSWRLLPLVF